MVARWTGLIGALAILGGVLFSPAVVGRAQPAAGICDAPQRIQPAVAHTRPGDSLAVSGACIEDLGTPAEAAGSTPDRQGTAAARPEEIVAAALNALIAGNLDEHLALVGDPVVVTQVPSTGSLCVTFLERGAYQRLAQGAGLLGFDVNRVSPSAKDGVVWVHTTVRVLAMMAPDGGPPEVTEIPGEMAWGVQDNRIIGMQAVWTGLGSAAGRARSPP